MSASRVQCVAGQPCHLRYVKLFQESVSQWLVSVCLAMAAERALKSGLRFMVGFVPLPIPSNGPTMEGLLLEQGWVGSCPA
jgi:hypothetical protein